MIKFIKGHGINKKGDQVLNHPEEEKLIEKGIAERIERFEKAAEVKPVVEKKAAEVKPVEKIIVEKIVKEK